MGETYVDGGGNIPVRSWKATKRKPHKVMTPEEYAAMPLQGWHEVCRDVDGFGGVGVRYLGRDETSRD